MAQLVDEGNFWLPSEFLTDEELLMDFKTDSFKVKRVNDFRNGYVNSFDFSTDLSSPAESVLGSAETESDEDDYVSGLTRKLAFATLGDSNFSAENTMGWELSGSPQSSTLCGSVTGCGCMPGLSRVSRVSVPPDGADRAAAWRSLLAAVEKRARMRLIEETAAFCSGNPFAHSRKPDTTDPNQGSGFYPNQSRVSYQQLQAAQFQQLKQQQQAGSYWGQEKRAHQQIVRNAKRIGGLGNQSLSMASWPNIQHCQPQPERSSGMRAVFLGETEAKSKRSGTGVFLPRKSGATPIETRKKTGFIDMASIKCLIPRACARIFAEAYKFLGQDIGWHLVLEISKSASVNYMVQHFVCGCPVFLPDAVVQHLNLNLKSMDIQQPQTLAKRSGDLLEANAALKHGNTISIAEQRRNPRPVPGGMNQELKLPQEWTY